MKSIDPSDYIQLSGPLFEEVQRSGIFNDSKTFVDCIPTTDPEEITARYQKEKEGKEFDFRFPKPLRCPIPGRQQQRPPWRNILNGCGNS